MSGKMLWIDDPEEVEAVPDEVRELLEEMEEAQYERV
jgi:hypothetical protein